VVLYKKRADPREEKGHHDVPPTAMTEGKEVIDHPKKKADAPGGRERGEGGKESLISEEGEKKEKKRTLAKLPRGKKKELFPRIFRPPGKKKKNKGEGGLPSFSKGPCRRRGGRRKKKRSLIPSRVGKKGGTYLTEKLGKWDGGEKEKKGVPWALPTP